MIRDTGPYRRIRYDFFMAIGGTMGMAFALGSAMQQHIFFDLLAAALAGFSFTLYLTGFEAVAKPHSYKILQELEGEFVETRPVFTYRFQVAVFLLVSLGFFLIIRAG